MFKIIKTFSLFKILNILVKQSYPTIFVIKVYMSDDYFLSSTLSITNNNLNNNNNNNNNIIIK